MAPKIGVHAATMGYTPACKLVMDILPDICLWLADTHHPENALNYPDAVHLLRLRNPHVGEGYTAWANRVDADVRRWYDSPIPPGALIFQHANEPEQVGYDLPTPWPIPEWRQMHMGYMAVLRSRYPGVAFLAPPFTSMHCNEITAAYVAPYEGIAVHSYWAAGNPGWRQGTDGGQTWRLAVPYGKPIYVTEVNSNPANADEVLAWLGEIDSDLVLGATLYIAGSDSDPQYVVSPQMATAIRAGISSPPVPESPLPPEPEAPPVTSYDPAMNPLTSAPPVAAWVPAIAGHNSVEAEDIVNAYRRYAPVIRYDANLALAQAVIETAWFTHPRWTESRNPAGIGITGDAVAGYDFGTIARGVQSHLALLNCYYGNGVDPWGPLTEAEYGRFVLGFTRLDQMNGVWATPGTHYAQTIVQITNEVTGGVVPPALPLPPPSTHEWVFVQPVDAPIIQGSMGDYSHAGRSPGFYALDYAPLPLDSPVYAIADGEVSYNGFNHPQEGQTGHTLCITHNGGYESRYCHLNQYDPPVGTPVRQSDQIALSGAPDFPYPGANGYGSGPHLHFSILQFGRWVKCEELMAQGMMAPIGVTSGTQEEPIDMLIETSFDDAELLRLWDGPKTAAQKKRAPFNKDFSIPQAWIRELEAGRPLGFAVSGEEHDAASNRTVEYFSNGKISFFPADGSVKIN